MTVLVLDVQTTMRTQIYVRDIQKKTRKSASISVCVKKEG